MQNREFKINEFISRGIIESNIEFAQNHNTPLSIVKFGYDVDVEDGYFFKDLIAFIHSYSDFNSILQQPNDTFIIFLRDCKIHQAKSIVTQMVQSMSRKENCWDNAVAESFFHSLKTELIYREIFETRAQANQAIFEYIKVFYNSQRMHNANGNLSPVEFEEKMLLEVTAA